jgi:hypothetical protein
MPRTRPATLITSGVLGGGAAAPVTYTISGLVTDGVNNIEGATVALGAYSAVTAANGTYTISDIPAGTSGTLTATKTGYIFTGISISAMTENLAGQNFVSAWYSPGFAPTAVYDATLAANLAASRVNLINPGTYDLGGVGSPTHSQANGWSAWAANKYFDTGITPGTTPVSVMIVTNVITAYGYLFGNNQASPQRGVHLAALATETQSYVQYGSADGYPVVGSIYSSPAVILLANNKVYVNGTDVGNFAYGTPDITIPLFLGTVNNFGDPHGNVAAGSIFALWLYLGTLSAGQVATLNSVAMANFT